MLNAAERPLIVAGGGIINADASDLLIEFAEITGVPVVPTLMGWGTIPDDHPLMAGMCGLQTVAPLRQRDDARVRLRARHRQPLGQPPHRLGRDVYRRQEIRACRHRADADRPGLRARLRHRLGRRRGAEDAARRRHRVEDGRQAARLVELGRGVPGAQADDEAQDAFRPGAAQAAARLRGDEQGLRPRHLLCHDDRPVADRRRAVPACLQAAQLDQLRPGRAARLDAAGSARRARRRPGAGDRGAVGRLRLPVPDRGAGGRRPAQAALHPRGREQRLSRPDPAGAARLPDGLRGQSRPSRTSTPPATPRPATASTMWRSPRRWAARRCASGARTSSRARSRKPSG